MRLSKQCRLTKNMSYSWPFPKNNKKSHVTRKENIFEVDSSVLLRLKNGMRLGKTDMGIMDINS